MEGWQPRGVRGVPNPPVLPIGFQNGQDRVRPGDRAAPGATLRERVCYGRVPASQVPAFAGLITLVL